MPASSSALTEALVVAVRAHGPGHFLERNHLVPAEALDKSEVEERHATRPMESIIARMRVTVERLHVVEATQDEPIDRLGRETALLARPRHRLVEARAVDQVAGQQPGGRQLIDDLRNADSGMTTKVLREQPLAVRLAPVVQLLEDSLSDLG
jgi:hypothetical protein